MARAVLNLERGQCWAVALVLALVPFAGSAERAKREGVPCSPRALLSLPPSRQREMADFLRRVESGPLYRELLHRTGKPATCNVTIEDTIISLYYAFRGGAQLEAKTDSSIEFSEQRAQIPGINDGEAVSVLRESEKDSFGEGGCGIDWNHPSVKEAGLGPGSREVVYRGNACNCLARTIHKPKTLVALVLSGAC